MKETIVIKDIVYEMNSFKAEIEDCGQTTIYCIRAYYSDSKAIENIKYYNKNYDIGSNVDKSRKLFNLITEKKVHPIHIEDIILDYIY